MYLYSEIENYIREFSAGNGDFVIVDTNHIILLKFALVYNHPELVDEIIEQYDTKPVRHIIIEFCVKRYSDGRMFHYFHKPNYITPREIISVMAKYPSL